MGNDLSYRITTTRFDEDYTPSQSSRATTNFANLARGEKRQRNLRNALTMIDRRANGLAHWDNPRGDRYTLELEIVSVELDFTADGTPQAFPLFEVLDIQIVDRHSGRRHRGIPGNNFSSYIRDYDFSVLLPAANQGTTARTIPDGFGELHGKLFQHFLDSGAYAERFPVSPVICISVSTSTTYHRTENEHPILGVEYRHDDHSLTDTYFGKMGLQVRYFMPPGAVAPLAFYHRGDLLVDYTELQLIGTIATMESFQKIYRPEIYNANTAAPAVYRPSLEAHDFSPTQVGYDRDERSRLAVEQGAFTAKHLMTPHGDALHRWAADRYTPAA